MKDYDEVLKQQFGDLPISLVKHDTSFGSYPTKIVVSLGRMPKTKDKGTTALDLSNYLSRMGLRFHCIPEYNGRGKSATLTFYMSVEHVADLVPNIWAAIKPDVKPRKDLPYEFRSLIIQDTSRGVHPKLGAA